MLSKKGFTLVELLITTVIVSLVGVAVYSIFANGINAWRRGTEMNVYERGTRFTLEKMARELRNTFEFSNIAFEGEKDSFKFPALILKEGRYEVGRIGYFYDEGEGALYEKEETYAEAFNESREESDDKDILIRNLKEMEFSYCYLDNATGTYKWKDDWKKEEQDTIPQAVKIDLVLGKEKAGKEKHFEKIIFIPIGTGKQKIELGGQIDEI